MRNEEYGRSRSEGRNLVARDDFGDRRRPVHSDARRESRPAFDMRDDFGDRRRPVHSDPRLESRSASGTRDNFGDSRRPVYSDARRELRPASGKHAEAADRLRSVIWQGQKDLDQERLRRQVQSGLHHHDTTPASKPPPLISELSDTSKIPRNQPSELPQSFTSPPLMPGLLSCLTDVVGSDATPTPIQALSLKWLLDDAGQANKKSGWKQFLLASETGSGKSIAYLLPVLQNLKQAELEAASSPPSPPPPGPKRALNPRALVLAPTHELSRQLSSFAKSLLHQVKLRVLCASRANLKSTKERDATARQMVAQIDAGTDSGEFQLKERSGFPVDVVVGTPMKLLEMVRGRGWDRREAEDESDQKADEEEMKLRRGRDKMPGFGKWRSKPEMGLANVEWVVVDEADVLFDPDFQETTRQLLADISEARGQPIPLAPAPSLSHPSPSSPAPATVTPTPAPHEYPFNLILTSATIPASLDTYLEAHHPKMMRLASPRLHRLPKTLQTEYVNWSGGNKLADIERRIRRVWAEDSSTVSANGSARPLSKILIFCNKSTKVDELGRYLDEQGIKNVGLSSTSEHRKRGSNHHLDGFMRADEEKEVEEAKDETPAVASDPKVEPHVMITTSLLSRGLDFSPSIRHVFIVDEPRNMIDFLHRAGRAGRAGERGKVVVFGKMTGRGSASAKDVRQKVGSLAAR
ncbi:hypothetical protein H0H92_003773 [Tricholoma furcatifolium]|nr:hypothetical protein H0H92_003773 [Tricholoma furcatifolium]